MVFLYISNKHDAMKQLRDRSWSSDDLLLLINLRINLRLKPEGLTFLLTAPCLGA